MAVVDVAMAVVVVVVDVVDVNTRMVTRRAQIR